MGHQPFETWILSGESLPPDQEQQLQEHLINCGTCQHLSSSWNEVDALLHAARLEKPAPGFTARWQARLSGLENLELRRKQKRASWLFFGVSTGAALLVLTYMIMQFFASVQAPVQVFITGLTLWAGVLTLVDAAEIAFLPLMELLLVNIPIYWWIIIASLVSLFVVLSSISIRYIFLPRRASV